MEIKIVEEIISRLKGYVEESTKVIAATAIRYLIEGKKQYKDLSPEDKTLFDCLLKAGAMELYALEFYTLIRKAFEDGDSDVIKFFLFALDGISSIQSENGVGLQTAFVVNNYKNGEKKND